MTDYKPGDRVRVSFEGTVRFREHGYLDVAVENSDRVVGLTESEVTVEKLTPDYKAQIEALEPGTAFVLTYEKGTSDTFLRVGGGVADKDTRDQYTLLDFDNFVGIGTQDLRILK